MTGDRLPYPPSIFDRVFYWMSRRPGRRWLYLVPYTVGVALLLASTAVDGQAGATRYTWVFVNALWTIFGYFAIDLIDSEVVRAADRFREVFPGPDEEFDEQVYRLSTMPSRTATSVWGMSFLVFLVLAGTQPAIADLTDPTAMWLQAPVIAFAYAGGPLLVYHTIRLLTGVSRILRRGQVNIFHLRPLYGFSRVTARVGVVYLAMMVLNTVSEAVLELGGGLGPELLIGFGLTAALASASFIAPLVGTHRRILDAKSDALQEHSNHLESLRSKMYGVLESGDHGRFEELDGALSGLLNMGQTIDNVSTWPWSKGTVRGFFTAIGIPLIVFVSQRFLDTAL